MEAKAIAKFVHVSPRKARFVMDAVRGKDVRGALALLDNIPNRAAGIIGKVVRSAAANAENNHAMSVDELRIARCFVDGGPAGGRQLRIQPRARGQAYRIRKRLSHITVVVTDEPLLPKGQRRRRRASNAERSSSGTEG
ncbi:MAG: 50S ribosomal protein L22 [Armatimonadetes bacterium]|jgi:large subunit ribosomal protein L22|nr:50S ribosomal protein L22 [Armatimonadota bacterium]